MKKLGKSQRSSWSLRRFWAESFIPEPGFRPDQNEEAQLIEQRIEQAAVLCYALEGSYPDEVSYLEQNYGVVIDHAKYNVFYQSLGSNLKPGVAVYRKGAAR
ncbi:MAG: hypothetical protein ACLVJ6_08355 [Merdibacter sp.]